MASTPAPINGTRPCRVRGPQYMVRVDHTINRKHTLWGRWLGAEQNTLGGDPLNSRPQVLPGYPARGEVFRPAHNIAVGLRSVLTPRLVNELTLGYSRFTFLFTQGEANPLFPNTPRFTFNNSVGGLHREPAHLTRGQRAADHREHELRHGRARDSLRRQHPHVPAQRSARRRRRHQPGARDFAVARHPPAGRLHPAHAQRRNHRRHLRHGLSTACRAPSTTCSAFPPR